MATEVRDNLGTCKINQRIMSDSLQWDFWADDIQTLDAPEWIPAGKLYYSSEANTCYQMPIFRTLIS